MAVVAWLTALWTVAVPLATATFPGESGRIAYDVAGDIHTVALSGSDDRNLTNDAARDEDPAVSPDGSRIAFTSYRDGPPAIFTMHADGGDLRRVTGLPTGDLDPAWSPDGSRIAFTSFRDGNAEIYVANADGSAPVRMTSHTAGDAKPAFSPDGSRIVFQSFRGGGNPAQPEIYAMNVDRSELTRLTDNARGNAEPAFSPNGFKIVFSSYRDDNYEIYMMDADGSSQVRLTVSAPLPPATGPRPVDPTVDAEPAFSPDGSRIAFRSTRDNRASELYTMNPDGSGVSSLTASGTFKQNVDWGPAPGPPPAGPLGVAPGAGFLPPPAFAGCPAATAAVLRAGAKAERITGTFSAERIFAGGGADRVDGLRGDDCIDLGPGDDRGVGGPGRDLLRGGSGRDRLSGSSGSDRVSGGLGDDRISARDGRRDTVLCGPGRDNVTADRADRVARDCERVRRRRR